MTKVFSRAITTSRAEVYTENEGRASWGVTLRYDDREGKGSTKVATIYGRNAKEAMKRSRAVVMRLLEHLKMEKK